MADAPVERRERPLEGGDTLRPAQREAVDAAGSVAVVAGAGTGKTHMLAHRFLKHVEDGLDPLEIVAVTFTERAAAELRARIRALLAVSLPPGARARLTVEAAQISTMHALAQRVCREFPEQAGVAPDFTILDDLEGGVWLTERIESALGEAPPELFDAIEYQTLKTTLGALLADPVTADEAFGHSADEWPALVATARAAALAGLIEAPAWRQAAAVVRASVGADGDRRELTRRAALTGLLQVAGGETSAGLETIAGLSLVGGSKKAFTDGAFAALGDAIRYLREATREALKAGLVVLELGVIDDRLAALLPLLKAAYRDIRQRLEAEKRARRVLDFADLEVHALRALSHAEVVAHYRSRWRALLVDEFQDTNAVQEKLLDALSEGMSVTVVGDEKQSIYGFRGAKAEVFERYRARVVAQGGQVVMLSESFRSHAGLVRDLNSIFAPLLAQQHQELAAVRITSPGDGPFTTLTMVTGGGARSGRQLSEARAVAAIIKGLVDARTMVHDKSTGGLRPVRFGDVAVLARGWQALGVYGDVLPALEVPAVHTGGGNLLATREAKDGCNLLRALTEPTDDVALVALLRSPFFAVDDVSLYHLAARRAAAEKLARQAYTEAPTGVQGAGGGERRVFPRVSMWETLSAHTGPGETLAHARAVIGELLGGRAARSPSSLVSWADSLTGHSAVLAGLPGGRRRLADYSGFIDLVRRLEVGSEDLFTVWRRLRALLAAEVEVARPSLAADGAVTLLTIHGSKGLEWPVVVVADLDRRGPTQGPPVLIDAALGVALRLVDEAGEPAEPALYRVLRAGAAAREEQEARRLLYVALTRARDHLVLSAAAEGGGALDTLEPGLVAGGVPRQAVEHDPDRVTYPALPRQYGHIDDVATDATAREEADVRLVGPVPPGASDDALGTDRHGEPLGAGDEWSRLLDLVAVLDDTWLPVTAALAEHGVPPPVNELAGRWLKHGSPAGGGPDASPAPYVLLAWRVGGGVLAVTPPLEGAPAVSALGTMTLARHPLRVSADDVDQRVWLLSVDPLDEIDVTVARVTAALSGVDGALAD